MKTAGQKEGAGLLERVTPGPFDGDPLRWMIEVAAARNIEPHAKTVNLKFTRPTLEMWMEQARAQATLAPDHGLLLKALTDGLAGVSAIVGDPSMCRVGVMELPHGRMPWIDTPRDAAGCPALTPELRSALRKVVGSNG